MLCVKRSIFKCRAMDIFDPWIKCRSSVDQFYVRTRTYTESHIGGSHRFSWKGVSLISILIAFKKFGLIRGEIVVSIRLFKLERFFWKNIYGWDVYWYGWWLNWKSLGFRHYGWYTCSEFLKSLRRGWFQVGENHLRVFKYFQVQNKLEFCI